MFLVYYKSSTSEENRWMKAETEEKARSFVEKYNVKEYYITVEERDYERLKNKIKYQEEKIERIKEKLVDIIEEV